MDSSFRWNDGFSVFSAKNSSFQPPPQRKLGAKLGPIVLRSHCRVFNKSLTEPNT